MSGVVTLTNCTIAENVADSVDEIIASQRSQGGGLYAGASSTVHLQNTILARNRSLVAWEAMEGPDCFGPLTSLGTNLIGDPTGCSITLPPASELTGAPGLDAFTDDGTPGNGHFPLLSTSQAINAGNDAACPLTDQLWHPRVERCDIGAIEFQPSDTTPPEITITATPETLWPPNGKLVPVTIAGTITDAGSGVNASTATYAVIDEYGSVQPRGPVTVEAAGSYAFTIHLQASRNGKDKDGRQYNITVYAQDLVGNAESAATGVTVPHERQDDREGHRVR